MLKAGDEPIPGYELERFLGKGQFGQVWQCTTPGKARAALKFLDLGGKQGWKEFRGIQRVKAIRHPHLMPITALWLLDEDWHVIDDSAMDAAGAKATGHIAETLQPSPSSTTDVEPRWLVVAQLLGDQTLGDLLQQHLKKGDLGIPVDGLLRYMEEAAKGIDFLNSSVHDLGDGQVAVQHCDIKPANILLVGDSVLICDFGVAQVLATDASTTATGMIGSPAFMAPECIEQKPSSASDQYSLAVTYVELRTGRLPFKSETYFDVIDAHRKGKLDLSRLPPAEQAVIRKATSVDPKDRYATTQEMVRELRRVVEGRAPVRTSRTKQWAMLCITVTALVAAIGFFIASLLQPERNENQPPKLHTFTLHVVPPDADVFIDQQQQSIDRDGQGTFDRKTNGTVNLSVRKDPEYQSEERRIELADHLDRVIEVQLKYRPDFLATRALDQWLNGDEVAAIADYVSAIERDPAFTAFSAPRYLLAKDSERPIYRMGLSPDGRWLLSGDASGRLMVWDLRAGDQTYRPKPVEQLEDSVESLAVGNRWFAAADLTGKVFAQQFEDVAPAVQLKLAQNLIKLAMTPDEKWLLAGSDDGSGSYQLQRWNLQVDSTGNDPVTLGTHGGMIDEVLVQPDNATVVTASWDRTVRQWSLTPPAPNPSGRLVGQLTGDVYCLAQLGSSFAFAGDGGSVNVAANANGADRFRRHRVVMAAIDPPAEIEFPEGHAEQIEVLRTSLDGRQIASASVDGIIQLWEVIGQTPRGPIPLVGAHVGKVNALSFDATGRWLVSAGDDGGVVLWDINAPASPARLGRHEGPVTQVIVLTDGSAVITCGDDGSVRQWDLRRSQLILKACLQLGVMPSPLPELANPIDT